jgi:hypothetical protein
MRIFLIRMNNTKPPFDNMNARKCLAHAFNYKGFIDEILKGNAQRDPTPLPNTLWGFPKDAAGYEYDMKKAKDYFQKAVAEGAPMKRPIEIHILQQLQQTTQAAQVFQADLASLGINLKIVSGYSSSADIMLAVERKEVDGRAGSYSSIQPFIDRKLVHPVIRARSSDKRLQQLPLDEDFAPNPRAKAIMALRSAPELIARPYVLPPATPADIVKTMRDAFEATIKDPATLAEAKKTQQDLEFTPGDEAEKILKEVLSQPKDIVDEFSKYIKFGE